MSTRRRTIPAKKAPQARRRTAPPVNPYRRPAITGKGKYKVPVDEMSWGEKAGSHLGRGLGMIGEKALGIFTGLGAYEVRKNVFLEGRLPEMVNIPSGGGIVCRFQEYLGDVITGASANTFKVDSYLVNAGNPNTFPWLSQIACNFEQYSFEGIIFQFKSTSADALNSTNTALGSVMLATQYDTLDAEFDSKLDMLNYEYSTSCKPSEDVLHMIECAPRMTTISELYVLYNQEQPANADPRLYNLGRFSVATTGFQAANVRIGQIHVTYQVRLMKPKLFTSLGKTSLYYELTVGTGASNVYDNNNPLGFTASIAAPAASRSNTIELIHEPDRLIFPASAAKLTYRVEIRWFGAAATLVYPVPLGIDCTVTSQVTAPESSVNVTTATQLLGIQVEGNDVAAQLVFPTGALVLPSGNNQVVVRVMQVDPTFLAQ